MEASRRLARSLCSLRSFQRATRVHPEPGATRPPFVPHSPNIFGGNLPNLPLTEFDPPNSPVSPFSSINLSIFGSDIVESGLGKRKVREKDQRVRSCMEIPVREEESEGNWVNGIRRSEFDLEWVGIKKRKTLHRWSEKGGFNMWNRDHSGSLKFISKAFSDVDMARCWGVSVSKKFERKSKGKQKMGSGVKSTRRKRNGCVANTKEGKKRAQPSSSSSSSVTSRFKRRRSEVVSSSKQDQSLGAVIELQEAILASMKTHKVVKETEPDQSPKQI